MTPLRTILCFLRPLMYGLLCSTGAYGHPVSILFGTIEFPKTLKSVPQYEIFYEGQKIRSEVDNNKLCFHIPINRTMLTRFFILFVENPSYVLKESDDAIQQNTVDYLKSGTAYRIFELQKQGTAWHFMERLLPDSLAIPDNTIIIYMPPSYIDTLAGGKGLELPHVMIKQNIMDLVSGSLEILQKKADELCIAAIDMSTFHVPAQEAMWLTGNKRIIVPTV